jgi:hypothetical protein
MNSDDQFREWKRLVGKSLKERAREYQLWQLDGQQLREAFAKGESPVQLASRPRLPVRSSFLPHQGHPPLDRGKCPWCGEQNPPTTRVCFKCGYDPRPKIQWSLGFVVALD